MLRALAAALLVIAAALLLVPPPRARLVQLAPGTVEIHEAMVLDDNTEVRGAASGSTLRAAADFRGRAVIVVRGNRVLLHDFDVEGNREKLESRLGLPGYDITFARFTPSNGVLADDVSQLAIRNVRFREIAGFAVLISRSRHIAIDSVRVYDSGSRNPSGSNNTTGGILLEEGTSNFRVTHCDLRNIRGNGIWTHSLYTSPRNAHGIFAENRFDTIGRDALQVGHATAVRVEGNTGKRIGFPQETVDAEPVGVDTAGNVDRSSYVHNRFSAVNGKCIDLDGFHDGEVSRNGCTDVTGYGIVMNNSNPDMQSRHVRIEDNLLDTVKYGGIFVIGEDNTIRRNRLLNLNTAHCGCYYTAGEPDMFRSGIYLGRGAARAAPARGNHIEENEITGYQIDQHCITAAPGIPPSWNILRGNRCR